MMTQLRRSVFYIFSFIFMMLALNPTSASASKITGQEHANNIASITSSDIYNLDLDQLLEIVDNYLNANTDIKGLEIFDTIDNQRLLSFTRINGVGLYNQDLNNEILSLNSFQADAIFNDEIFGKVIVYIEVPNPLSLTQSELDWIAKNPVVKMGVDEFYPPFEYVENGQYKGIANDVLKELSELTGIQFERQTGLTWQEVVQGLQSGTIDMAPVITNNDDWRKFLVFTNDYLKFPKIIVTQRDNQDVTSLSSLGSQTLVLPQGYTDTVEIPLKYPDLNIIEVPTPLDALREVAAGRSVATHGTLPTLSYLIKSNEIKNLKIAATSDMGAGNHAMGIRKDLPELQSILTKALFFIGQTQINKIQQSWIDKGSDQQENATVKELDLTDEEKDWIKNNPVISVGVEEWFPFIKFDEPNSVDGISGDFIKLVMERRALKLKLSLIYGHLC